MKIAVLKPVFLPTGIKQVDDNLYRGNAVFSPLKALRLKKKGITQVVDLRAEDNILEKYLKKMEKFYLRILGINYVNKKFDITNFGRFPNIDFFEGLNEQINKGDKTYIHCHFGKHRTSFVIAMLQKSLGIPDDVIIDNLKKIGWETEKRQKLLNIFLQKFFKK